MIEVKCKCGAIFPLEAACSKVLCHCGHTASVLDEKVVRRRNVLEAVSKERRIKSALLARGKLGDVAHEKLSSNYISMYPALRSYLLSMLSNCSCSFSEAVSRLNSESSSD